MSAKKRSQVGSPKLDLRSVPDECPDSLDGRRPLVLKFGTYLDFDVEALPSRGTLAVIGVYQMKAAIAGRSRTSDVVAVANQFMADSAGHEFAREIESVVCFANDGAAAADVLHPRQTDPRQSH